MAERRKKMAATTAENLAYTGLAAQLVYDETKKVGVFHDGSEAGGHYLAKESLQNYAPKSTIMAGAYAIGNYTVAAQRSAYVGTNGKEFILRDNYVAWRGASAGHSSSLIGSTLLHNAPFASTGPTFVLPNSGANLYSKLPWEEFTPNAATAGGYRHTNGALLFLGDGSMGGFHARFTVSFPHANTTDITSNFFVGMKKVSSFINSDMNLTATDHLGIGTSSTTLLTNPRLLLLSGGGGSTANNVAQDTTMDIAQHDVLELELLSLPFESRVVHWRVAKLNNLSQVVTGTVTGSGNNMPASTDPLYLYMHRYHPTTNGTWRLNSVWWRNFAEMCGAL